MLLSKHFPIETLVNQIVAKMKLGGRLFYIGAGTSGRLESWTRQNVLLLWCSFRLSKRIIAGGDIAIQAVENARTMPLRLGKIYKNTK
jgi:N-acetylmuramic acid 6-phosphate etherase